MTTGSRYLLIDKIIAVYAVILAGVAFTRIDLSAGNWGVAIGHLMMLLLIWMVRRPGHGPVGKVLGDIYPLLLLLPLYGALDVLHGPQVREVYDAVVQGWERAIFGGLPSEDWWRRYPSPVLSFVLHSAYWAYYIIVPAPILYFAFKGDRAAARRSVLFELGTFLYCYLWFVFFPVAGPYYVFAHPTGSVVDNPAARLVYMTLASGGSYGAAFPSSHVAATTAAVIGAWMGSRKLGYILAIPAILLAIGTVYCHMHYAIDAVLGLLTGIILPLLLLRWDAGRSGVVALD